MRREGHALPMRLRRLCLAEHGRSRAARGVHKARRGRAASRLTPSVGAIFGATLKSVLDYSGVDSKKARTVEALRHVARFLDPTRAAIERCPGEDRPHLANGLVAHRVASAQRRGLAENREARGERSYLGRHGLKDIAVGATAAILIAHYVMSVHGTLSPEAALAGLADALASASALLAGWPVGGGADHDWHIAALRAEERAIGRVRAAGAAAAAVTQRLPHVSALQLQLDWMRAAAWPRGVRCDALSHLRTCAALAAGEPLGRGGASELANALPPIAAVPLAALPAEAWMSSAASEASSSSEDGSDARSLASSASLSSASSVGSYEAEEAHMTPEETQLACRMFSLI